jgi:hypothetical protein
MKRMKQFIFIIAICMATIARAQNTNIQATITDPHSIPYSFGTGSVSLVCPGNAAPTYNGYTVNRNYVITGLDGNGFFTLQLHDLGFLDQSSCNYRFAITWKDGVTSFIAPGITGVTGVGPVDLSSAISAFSVLLPTSGGGIGGVVNAGQEVYGLSPGVVASSPNFTWNQGSLLADLLATSPATSIANQSSPSLNFVSNYWTGTASAQSTFTCSAVPNAGTNPPINLVCTQSGAAGAAGVDLSALQGGVIVNKLEILGGGADWILQSGATAGKAWVGPLANPPQDNMFLGFSSSGNPIGLVYRNSPWSNQEIDLTGQNAAIAGGTVLITPFLTVPANQYRISWDAKVTTADGVSSTLGPLAVTYVDPDGVSQTVTAAAVSRSGTIETTDTGDSTTKGMIGIPLLINSNGVSNSITYSFGYASNSAGAMHYNLHIRNEAVQ